MDIQFGNVLVVLGRHATPGFSLIAVLHRLHLRSRKPFPHPYLFGVAVAVLCNSYTIATLVVALDGDAFLAQKFLSGIITLELHVAKVLIAELFEAFPGHDLALGW